MSAATDVVVLEGSLQAVRQFPQNDQWHLCNLCPFCFESIVATVIMVDFSLVFRVTNIVAAAFMVAGGVATIIKGTCLDRATMRGMIAKLYDRRYGRGSNRPNGIQWTKKL